MPFRHGRFITLHHRRGLPRSVPPLLGRFRNVVKGSLFASKLPDRLGRIEFAIRYGLVIRLRLLSTLPHGNAVTTFDFRPVTLAWKGLPPFGSHAFTGALAAVRRAAVGSG